MAGSLPAGTETPVISLYKASPADWPGKKHSIIAVTSGDDLAQLMSSGPALNRSSITGAPLPGQISTSRHTTSDFILNTKYDMHTQGTSQYPRESDPISEGLSIPHFILMNINQCTWHSIALYMLYAALY